MFAKVDAALRDVMYLMGEYILFSRPLTFHLSKLPLVLEPDLKVVEQYQEIMVHRF